MHKDFWQKRWDEGQIGFHEGRPNAFLERFSGELRTCERPRVLVPLCGKAVDLRWLAQHDFSVIGVEFVAEAARDFFQESGWTPTHGSDGGLPASSSHGVSIAVGDFFAWDATRSDPVDVAYDRAALVAMRPEERERYAAHLLGALRPGGRILLVTFAYEQASMSGPPFSVDAQEVQRLFSERCELRCLADEDIVDREPRFRQRGLGWLREQAWLLQAR